MAEVKWIKLATDIFDNRKIRMIEAMPDGNAIIVIWVKLLCLAGNVNDCGMVYFTQEIPYNDQMLATQFNMPIATVQLALKTFEEFDMVEVIDNILCISNWEKYQNIEGMDRIREQGRQRVARHREKQKQLACNVTGNVTVTHCNAIEEDIEEEKDKEIEIDKEREVREKIDYQKIVDLYNTLCPSFPSVTYLSENRRKAIKARLNTYKIEDFEAMFKKAQESSFLKGGNGRSWIANFDWMLKDANMAKILDGNYADKSKHTDGQKPPLSRTAQELDDFYTMAADWAQKGD